MSVAEDIGQKANELSKKNRTREESLTKAFAAIEDSIRNASEKEKKYFSTGQWMTEVSREIYKDLCRKAELLADPMMDYEMFIG